MILTSTAQLAFDRGLPLPNELGTDLTDARGTGASDVAEIRIADIPARIVELSVIENVEEFTPKLESHCFSDGDSLHQTDISIVEARTMEKPAVSRPETSALAGQNIPNKSARGCGERALVEVSVGGAAARILDVDRPYKIRHIRGGTPR